MHGTVRRRIYQKACLKIMKGVLYAFIFRGGSFEDVRSILNLFNNSNLRF